MIRRIALGALSLLLAGEVLAEKPTEKTGATNEKTAELRYTDDDRSHWSFQPVVRPRVPQFAEQTERAWIRTPIDAFVLSQLKGNELQPAAEANRRTLIRRLSYDLIGLPPSPEEIENFLDDSSPMAYEQLVDRLLADPRHGERWGQHWLDVVRFAESEGYEYDRHRNGAWGYRDYVIAAFNDNKPYSQFIL